jgi:hypothetical protein
LGLKAMHSRIAFGIRRITAVAGFVTAVAGFDA